MGKRRTSEEVFDDKLNKLADQSLELKTKAKKKEKKMSAKKIVTLTIVSTLLVLATLAGTFYAGTQYEANRHTVIKAEAAKLVDELKSQSK